MNPIQVAVEELYEALGTVDGLRRYRGIGQVIDPPAAVVGLPRLSWELPGSDPSSATVEVAIAVARNGREFTELLRWPPLVAAAIEQARAGVVRNAAGGTVLAGGGVELPAYVFDVDVAL